jgi:multidrug efflux pump subunit AcrB
VTSWVGWFAQNHVAANLAMMLIVVGGLLTIPGITQEVFPEIRPEMITVTVRYPGSTPEEVEEGICIRIEEEIQGVEGVDRITSTANEGVGSVSAELMRGENASEVLDEIKSIVDAIDTFPDESEKPVIQEVVRKRQVIDVVVSQRRRSGSQVTRRASARRDHRPPRNHARRGRGGPSLRNRGGGLRERASPVRSHVRRGGRRGAQVLAGSSRRLGEDAGR